MSLQLGHKSNESWVIFSMQTLDYEEKKCLQTSEIHVSPAELNI